MGKYNNKETSTGFAFVTTEEAALLLKVTKGHILNLVSKGLLKRKKVGNRNRYALEDLQRLVVEPERRFVRGRS